ncbi:hypothetical protein BC831DRAFT_453013, partial [Entophlyctis helioformis]
MQLFHRSSLMVRTAVILDGASKDALVRWGPYWDTLHQSPHSSRLYCTATDQPHG